MLSWVTAPFACIFLGLIGFKLDDYFQEQKRKKMEIKLKKEKMEKFEDMEKEMRRKGMDENVIDMARFFFTD